MNSVKNAGRKRLAENLPRLKSFGTKLQQCEYAIFIPLDGEQFLVDGDKVLSIKTKAGIA